MSKISEALNAIMDPANIYGKDIRKAIHDGIEVCYDDVTSPALNSEAFKAAVQSKIDDGSIAAMTIGENSLTGDKLADETITKDKLGEDVQAEFSSLKGDKVDKPLTTDDGKIPRAKSGNVEWVEVGQPTDEQTNSAVTNWLNEHPEATTTVYDGAISEKKINANFLLWIKKDYVTPEMFGAQGDGIKDDSDAFQKCIDSGKPINLLPSKEYLIKKTIKIIDRVNFAVEGNYSKINFSCHYLFEICNSSNFLINNILLLCNGNNGFKFTARTGTDRCGKTLFKNISFWNCLIGFEINTPCGYLKICIFTKHLIIQLVL